MSDSETEDADLDKDTTEETESNKDDSTLTEEAVDDDRKDDTSQRKPLLEAIAEMTNDTKVDKLVVEEPITEVEKNRIPSPKVDSFISRSPHRDLEKKMGMKVLQVEVTQASPVKTQISSFAHDVKAVISDQPVLNTIHDASQEKQVASVTEKELPTSKISNTADDKTESIYDFHEEKVDVGRMMRLSPKALSEKVVSSEEPTASATASSETVVSDEGKPEKPKAKRAKKESAKGKSAKLSSTHVTCEDRNTRQDKISSAEEEDGTVVKSEGPETEMIDVTTQDVKEEKLKQVQKKRGRPEKARREKGILYLIIFILQCSC